MTRMDDPRVTITAPLSEWKVLLAVEDHALETYTEQGVTLFNIYAAIHHAVDPRPRTASSDQRRGRP